MGGNMNIAIGDAGTGIAAVVSDGDSPTVTSVGLGNVNGVTLAVGPGAGDAKAEKSGSTYKISGNATGIDMANPMAPVTKPFEIEVTCP
jgi:lipoprotein LpqH